MFVHVGFLFRLPTEGNEYVNSAFATFFCLHFDTQASEKLGDQFTYATAFLLTTIVWGQCLAGVP